MQKCYQIVMVKLIHLKNLQDFLLIFDLRSIQSAPRGDSTFVLHAVKFLYPNEHEKLRNKTVLGIKRPSKNAEKEKMTSEKKQIMDSIFNERLKGLAITSAEHTERAKKLNQFIKSAFANISKLSASKNTEDEIRQRLDLDK